MALNEAVSWDWQVYGRATRLQAEPHIWSRFPVELGPDLIVSPHLFDWPPGAPRGTRAREVHTCAGAPELAVFAARGEAHRRFLEEEVVPRVSARVRFVCLVDADEERVAFAPLQGEWLGVQHLGPLLRIAYGAERIPSGLFDELGRRRPERPRASAAVVGRAHAARVEAHPLRLWEALFWRGHAYRYELVDGEVPLVGDLVTPLGANRTLMQLVRDAQRLAGARAEEAAGWIQCGRFRLRQQGRLVEVRVRLAPADVRVAFLPQAAPPGAAELPSLLGALMAGGDNGKTELVNGFTWSSVLLASATEALGLAARLRSVIEHWTEAPATILGAADRLWPEDGGCHGWFLRPDDDSLTIYAPFAREGCLPWHVHTGFADAR